MSLIFSDDFESDDFATWDDDSSGTALYTSAASAIAGSYGVEIENTTTTQYVSETLSTSGTANYRLAFRFNKNDISFNSGEEKERFVYIVGNPSGNNIIYCRLGNVGGTLRLSVDVYDDSDVTYTVTYDPSSADITVEARMVRATGSASNDGRFDLYINGSLEGSQTSIDNYDRLNEVSSCNLDIDTRQSAAGGSGSFYLDDISFRDDDTPIFSNNAFRFLGFETDDTNLYVAGLKNGTLKLYDYDLSTVTENGTSSFGDGTDAEIDAQTRGIFPVAKPFADQVLYLYGRDGNNTQVQYNDLNGTLGWTDIGAGTATWGTDKMAAGLHPHPLAPNDVMVVFTDNDVYRTLLGTVTWAKMGDATGTVRTTARSPSKRAQLVAAGTAAGTIYHTQNIGVSFEDAGGTAMGTINAFEFNSGAVL